MCQGGLCVMNKKGGVLAVFTVTLLIVTGFGNVAYGGDDSKNDLKTGKP